MRKYHLYLFALLVCLSCTKASNPKETFLKRFNKGIIIDRIECKGSIDQSYCLYMPTSYNINNSYPVIYAFDPHGDGYLPVSLLKEISEKYNYIVVGSNNCRNGLSSEELNNSLNQLLTDTKNKLAIDTNRIYLCGFSGGARIACSLAQSIPGVKGVIACSAGFQPNNTAPAYTFIGVTSPCDMNYLELKKTDEILQNLNAKSYFILFDGKHEWCPQSVLDESVTIFEIQAMKEQLIAVNKNIINDYINGNIKIASLLNKTKNTDSLIKAYIILNRTIKVTDKLCDISKLKTLFSEISQNTELQEYIKQQKQLENYENQKQQEFMYAFENKQDAWWNTELKKLDADSKDLNSLKSNMAKRLNGYISLSCYGYSNRALQTQNWKYAELFTHIYQKVDPENPDCYYALACLYANTNQHQKAIESLKTAIKYGFSNRNKLQNNPMFNQLHGKIDFDNLLNNK